MVAPGWLTAPPRFLFFTGKGGVGKTSLASATAVTLADRGRRVLLVSTDPASNLGQVFGLEIGREPLAVSAVAGLTVWNIDPEGAAAAYRERVLGPVREALPADLVAQMTEQLSGACTTEIAAFDEFTALLTEPRWTEAYDHLIFDTAPTGHTLRLLALPAAWSSFLAANDQGASCLGLLSGLNAQKERYEASVRALADPARTILVLVSRPERTSLGEAERTREELARLGIANQRLAVNALFPNTGSSDPLARAMADRHALALANLPPALAALPVDRVPLRAGNAVGVDALRRLLTEPIAELAAAAPEPGAEAVLEVPGLGELVDEIATPGHGLVMVMGKGGVGKTTLAAAIAVELASRGHAVHLTTTDPAAHLVEAVADRVENLTVDRIDPQVETAAYRERILATRGKDLDAGARALLEEDLRSPCTEEVAVFHAFSKVLLESTRRFVVLDTAPTGHTLLLLDATGSYHREVMRGFGERAARVTTPLQRLQDPEQSKLLIVTLAETTPVLEAAELERDLRRAGIEPWAWVINASLAAARPSDPLLRRRARAEVEQIERVRSRHTRRLALVAWQEDEPTGAERLRRLVRPAVAVAV
jgi:arsenite-transporting ATPase